MKNALAYYITIVATCKIAKCKKKKRKNLLSSNFLWLLAKLEFDKNRASLLRYNSSDMQVSQK